MLLLTCFLFPLVFSCAATPFLEGPGVVSLTRRVVLPTPRRSDSQGKAQSWAGAFDAPFSGILSAFFVCQRVTGTLGRTASRAFLSGKGALFAAPSQALFHTARLFFSRPRFVFCLGLRGPLPLESSLAMHSQDQLIECIRVGVSNSENCSENSLQNSETPKPRLMCGFFYMI